MSLISPIGASVLSNPIGPVSKPIGSGGDFGSFLKSAVQQVDSAQQQANSAVDQFLQGNGELHNVALATQRAEMTLDLGIQVRNKVLSAYQEIMKMQL